MVKIAIDGPAGSGKSTISKLIAQKLGIEYIDTGAMYRAITLKALRIGIDLEDEKQYDFLESTTLDICNGRFIMDEKDVSEEIRSIEVTNAVSTPSKISRVRDYLVAYQRKISSSKSCIMDGRDIGTIVLPDASIKIYLDATIECRARRRMLERKELGINLSLEETIKEIELRDWKDSTRKHSPLRCAEDAVVIDSTDLSIDEVVSRILQLVYERTKKMSTNAYKEGQNVRGMIINVTKEVIYLTVDEDKKAVIYANDLKGYQEGQKLYDTYYEGQEFEGSIKQIAKDKKTGELLLILSTKLEDEKEKLSLFEKIKENDEIIQAKVIKVTSAGADLDYQGFKLFLPTKYIDLKEEALHSLKGQMLDVMVLYVNKDRLQVTVSNVMAMKKEYRLAKEKAYAALSVGMVVEGEVENVLGYGAIINLGEVRGLLHHSEIDHKPVRNVAARLKVGDKVKVEYPATSLLAYSVEQKGGCISIKCKANIKTFSLKSKKVPDIIIEMPRGLTADCEFEVSAGTLCLESGEYGNITGEINAGCADMREITCSDMRLNLDAGALTAGSIICHRFESEVNAGKAEIAQVCASDAKLSVNAGKATVNSFDCRRTSVNVSAGAASITMSGKKEDYDIDITKTLGSCNIKSSQSPVDRSLTARVSFGSLSVSFSK